MNGPSWDRRFTSPDAENSTLGLRMKREDYPLRRERSAIGP